MNEKIKINDGFWFGAKDNLSIGLISQGLQIYSDIRDEVKLLKGNTPIFLDTNVLTHYYKISFSEREKLKNTIEKYKARIIITRQVEKEFIKNRTGIIRQFNGRLKESLVDKFQKVRKSIVDLNVGKINGLEEYINDKVIKNDFPDLSHELAKIYSEFKTILKSALDESKISERIEQEGRKVDKIMQEATIVNNAHEKNDQILKLLAEIKICNNLDDNEKSFLKDKYKELLDKYNSNKGDEKTRWQYTFPGCGESKDKEDPTGDFIIYHEVLKYMKENQCNAIFLTNDITKYDWLDENKEQYTHYIENMYSNTNQMIFIMHAEEVLGVSYKNAFEEKLNPPKSLNYADQQMSQFEESNSYNNQLIKEEFDSLELSTNEKIVMYAIADNQEFAFNPVSVFKVNRKLERLGFKNITINVLTKRLINKGLLITGEEDNYRGEYYPTYEFTQNGEIWITENFKEDLVEKYLKELPQPGNRVTLDELPF